jgi:hypothetical protein
VRGLGGLWAGGTGQVLVHPSCLRGPRPMWPSFGRRLAAPQAVVLGPAGHGALGDDGAAVAVGARAAM